MISSKLSHASNCCLCTDSSAMANLKITSDDSRNSKSKTRATNPNGNCELNTVSIQGAAYSVGDTSF